MKNRKNRKVVHDSFRMAVSRSLFIRWMKRKGVWEKYKNEIREDGYEAAWKHPMNPEDFLGKTSFLYYVYLDWFFFVANNTFYFNDTLYQIEKQLVTSC